VSGGKSKARGWPGAVTGGGGAVRIGSLFSGIGGLELGLERAGLGPVAWQVEIDPFCRGVLATHWPSAGRHEDVRRVGAANLSRVDLICGGFPCQDVSAAGLGAGIEGARSGLWREFARIVGEIRPRLVVVENVASGKRRWLPTVRRDLHVLGYRSVAVEVSAFDVGAPHKRSRVFVVAHADREGQPREARGREGGLSRTQWVWTRDGGGARWTALPPVCGVAHGVPRRLDRLRALGNAVVPQCAEAVGRWIVTNLVLITPCGTQPHGLDIGT
jgi:DNA (cytosine-5)-methyltransferase 1